MRRLRTPDARSVVAVMLVGSLLVGLGIAASGCGRRAPGTVRIVAAASMRGVLDELALGWEAEHPGARVTLQTGGSTALARRLVELDADADLVVLADVDLFTELLRPTWTRFQVAFAADRIVLAHTPTSRGAELFQRGEVPARAAALAYDWPAVLARDDVRVAMADPDLAPVGYRTLQALQLFDLEEPGADVEALVRGKVGRRYLFRDVAELIAPLQAGAIDFAFLYGSTPRHVGLEIIELPPAANLGDPALADEYARAAVEVAGRQRGTTVVRRGAPILYGASVRGAGESVPEALDLLQRLIDEDGRARLRRYGFEPVAPPRIDGDVPEAVRDAISAAGSH